MGWRRSQGCARGQVGGRAGLDDWSWRWRRSRCWRPPARPPTAVARAAPSRGGAARPPVARSPRIGGGLKMSTLTIVVVVLAALVLLGLALSVRVVKQYERGVLFRLGRVSGGPGARADPDHPGDRRAAAGVAADRDHADPVPGHHHPRQRQRRRLRGRLLPRDRRGEVGGRHRERGRGHRPDRPDHPAQGGRPAHPGRDPVRDRPDQRQHPRDPGRAPPRNGAWW